MILPETAEQEKAAQALSLRLGLPLFSAENASSVVLMVGENNCWLRRLSPAPVIDWTVDFTSPEYQYSFAQRTRFNDPLSRAIGLHKKTDLRVLDMTAGLGKDALWLARCGAQVTLIERHPALAYLLEQAIEALSKDPQNVPLASRMKVFCRDSTIYLEKADAGQFDVAYYDPMFAARTKTALVKKDMQILQLLHGEEAPNPALIPLTLSKIPKLIVKRAKADPILSEGVHHQLMTKVTRFDVYVSGKGE